MRALDFAPLLRSSVGYENLNRLMDFASRGDAAGDAYPPYNIEKLGEDSYRVQIAAAGFATDEIDIVVQENTLVVSGRGKENVEANDRTFLHRGIAKRAFERRFQLADTIKVTGASYADGMLNVDLVREVPEHKKPRKIEINADPATARVVEGIKLAAA